MSFTINGCELVHSIAKRLSSPTVNVSPVFSDNVSADTAVTEHVDWSIKFPVDAYSVVIVI